jgi:hypothetical protein
MKHTKRKSQRDKKSRRHNNANDHYLFLFCPLKIFNMRCEHLESIDGFPLILLATRYSREKERKVLIVFSHQFIDCGGSIDLQA